jgi:queuine tRNA-ribosyltransferase
MTMLQTPHGPLGLPAFLPDATRAVVRTVDCRDLENCGVPALMVNTLHVSATPGLSVVRAMGGIHRFMGWSGPVATDSGGFQVYSLAAAGLASVSEVGFSYRSGRRAKRQRLDPRSCVRKQFQADSDIMFCLDHCVAPGAGGAEHRLSVNNTIRWAQECREVHLETARHGERPLLYAVIQGGENPALRRECAQRLLEIGFDGYGYGGWPISDSGGLVDSVAMVAELVPRELPLHALGIGKPENLVRAWRFGYDTFDCVIPTRDARHGRMFAFRVDPARSDLAGDFYESVYVDNERSARDGRPVDETCDCVCCRRYSRSYLRHLRAIEDPISHRLSTIHNLRFYIRLCAELRDRGRSGE